MRKRGLWAITLVGLSMLGCACMAKAPAQPPGDVPEFERYPHYVLDSKELMLRGKTPFDDLPLSVCDADEESKAKCAVFMHDVMTRIFKDMAELRIRLIACESEAGR